MEAPRGPIVAAVAGLTLIGLALRLSLFDDSLYADELATRFTSGWHSFGGMLDVVRSNQENTPPLYYALAWVTDGLGVPQGLRLPALVSGVAAIPLTYLVGARTVGTRAALIGAGLAALAPFMIFFSTEARAYSTVLALGLCSTLFLLIALERRGAGWWALYALVSVAAAYTHYPVIFVLLAQFAWAFVTRPESRVPLVAANAAAALAFLPWLPGLREDFDSPTAVVIAFANPFSAEAAIKTVANALIGSPLQSSFLSPVPGAAPFAMLAAGLLLGVAGLPWRGSAEPARAAEAGGPARAPHGLALILALALVTPIGLAVFSALDTDIFIGRSLSPSWPAFALAIGALLSAAGPRWLRLAATALVGAAFCVAAAQMLDLDNQRPDTEAAARYIEGAADPLAPVVDDHLPTPGPRTALEEELDASPDPGPGERAVITMQLTPLSERLSIAAPGDPNIFPINPFVPLPTAEEAAAEAARRARGGQIVLVAPGRRRFGELSGGDDNAGRFVRALPPGYRAVEQRSFPGRTDFAGSGFTVYLLERA